MMKIWQWFAGAYKGFNTAGPSAARDDGTPVEPEKSIAKEIGVRYGDLTFCYVRNWFSH